MATINASSSADIIVPSNNGTTYRGLGGDDTYIISNAASGNITIVDTSGSNTVQLVDGLSIASTKFAADSVQLTLSNGAVLTVNGADKFSFEVGGNATSGVSGASVDYAGLASAMGVSSLPTGSTISDGTGGTISGTSVGSSVSYSLSASANTVAEGSSITYTVTASASSTSATTLTYSVVGDDLGGSATKADSADIVSLSGTVTLAAGETSATFDITPNADTANEGLEGIKVSLLDGANAVVGSHTASISNTASTVSTTSNLTTGVDTVAAGDGDNIVGGTVQGAGLTGSTANPGDVIDGGAGTDVFKLSIAGTLTANVIHNISGIELVGVEEISVNNFQVTDTAANTYHVVDMALSSSVTTIGVNSSSAGGTTHFKNMTGIPTLKAASGHGDITIDNTAAAVAGTADVQNIELFNYSDGAGASGTITLDNVEVINVDVSGVNLFAALTAGKALTYTFTGNGYYYGVADVANTVYSIDASTTAGAGINVGVSPITATYAVTMTGGAGPDQLVIGSDWSKYITFDGGAGADTLSLSTPADISSTSTGGLSNVEIIKVTGTGTTALDLQWLPEITTIVSSAADSGDGDTVTFTNMNDDNSTAIVTGSTTTPEGIIGTRTIDGDSDTVDLTIGQATVNGQTFTALTFNDAETLNVTVNQSLNGATATATTIGGTDLTTLTVSGAGKLTITAIGGATLMTKIDATASTGGLVMPATNPSATFGVEILGSEKADTLEGGTSASYGDTIKGNGGNDTIQGGAGNDTIHGGAGADIIMGEAGIDNIDGGEGNDVIHVDVVANFEGLATAETVDGGAGTDTLNFGSTVQFTVETTDLLNVKNIEKITFDTSNATNSTIAFDDAFFTSNGSTSIIVLDTQASGALTVSGAAMTDAANSLTIYSVNAASKNDSFTGGPGDDLFIFASTADADVIDGSDIITGGKGSDTLQITTLTIAANIAITTTVTSVENFTFKGVGTTASAYTLADASVVTSALQGNTGTIDATGMTGSGGLTFDGSAENDSDLVITGGRGGDTLTGSNTTVSAFSGVGLFDTIKGGDGADIINGKAGIDVLHGEGGNDDFRVTTLTDFISLTSAETVDGGSGTDTLTFDVDSATTVAAADLQGVSNIEIIEFEGTGADALTLSDSVFTANGSTSIRINEIDGSATFTLNAGGVSAANSITYRHNNTANDADATESLTFGGGNDTAQFRNGARFDTADVISFGGGTDTLNIWAAGTAVSATLTNVTSVENILITQVSNATVGLTLADGNFVSTQAGTINAGGLVSALTLDASPEDDSGITITGGIGGDTITGTDAKLSGTTILGDTINGGNGADIIDGSLGADTITGGAGADVFTYNVVADSAGDYVDEVTDFLDGTDTFVLTIDRSAVTTGSTITASVTIGKASKSAAVESLTGIPGQAIYVTDTGHLYVNANNDALLTSLDYKIKVNAGATALKTFDYTNDDNIKWTLTGGTGGDTITGSGLADIIDGGNGADTLSGGGGADTITGGTGVDIINGGTGADIISDTGGGADVISSDAGADIITITDTTAVDTIILADAEIGTGTAADGDVTTGSDQITGFVLATGKDKISIDISAIEAISGVIDLVTVGTPTISISAGASVILADGDNATDVGNGANATVLLAQGVAAGLAAADVGAAFEIGGSNEITTNGAWTIGDAFITLADDGINSALFLIVFSTGTAGDGATFAAGELIAIELLQLTGVAAAETGHADNFVFIA